MIKAAAIWIIGFCASPVWAEDTVVFAAASLKEPIDQIAADAGNVVVSYGGSGTLARQISLGAPADVVILANADWMDVLEDGAHIVPESRMDVLGNTLVLLGRAPGDVHLTDAGLSAALGDGRLAMGFVNAVPAGIYGQAALQELGLWEGVADLVAEVDSVRAAVALLARGEVPLAVGYVTDAALVDGVYAVATFPSESHPPIRYVAAATDEAGLAFLAQLQSDAARDVFRAAGFQTLVAQ